MQKFTENRDNSKDRKLILLPAFWSKTKTDRRLKSTVQEKHARTTPSYLCDCMPSALHTLPYSPLCFWYSHLHTRLISSWARFPSERNPVWTNSDLPLIHFLSKTIDLPCFPLRAAIFWLKIKNIDRCRFSKDVHHWGWSFSVSTNKRQLLSFQQLWP